ncbi:AAA family ATPase [Paenibacillus silvae]|uniref:ATP-dependent nuclease n=1 Tax=Paenibacillus silvae TaxID=1325358 RepID=UPI0025A1146B|nr:AAA family ATPase [Paenibacillus silvae]MDM5278715.1 AAA family ATPase [Paenibacillus silvae]
MYISKINLRNFRNFKNNTFKFIDGVNTLIGENGAGKTNVFYAMRLLLDSDLPRSIKFTESDFNRKGDWKGHWIIINMEFSDLGSSEGIQSISHGIEHMDGTAKGSYCMYYRPKKAIRQGLFDITSNGGSKKDLDSFLTEITLDDYEVIFTCRGKADFSDDAVYSRYIGDFDRVIFPDPSIEAQDYLGVSGYKFSLYNEVTCTYVKALRDAVYELRNTKNNPLLSLMRGMSEKIAGEHILDQVDNLNSTISGLDEVQSMKQRIISTLQNTVGITYSPVIDIKSQLPSDLEKLLQSLTLWVGDSDDEGYQGQLSELSLGGANIIYISLKLLEYELKLSAEKSAHFLLIEEPEAHIHTHVQKTLFDKTNYQNTQVIISTHSTHISAANKIGAVNILAKRNHDSAVFQPSNGLNDTEVEKIERYLDAVRSTVLFAKGVILVEGDAELILIPAMFKKVFDISLDEIGVSLVSVSSTVFTHIANLFNEDRIQRYCAIITDLDKSIVELPDDPEYDSKFQKRCRASENVGERRRAALDLLSEENDWIQPFYATYTFEVDFLLNDNAYEIVECLDQVYERGADIEKSKELLNLLDVSQSGIEVLRLAKKVGKGWLALLIAEHLNFRTYIPEYILDAVAFSCSHLTDSHFEKMADFRLNEGVEEDDEDYKIAMSEVERLKGMGLGRTEYITEYMSAFRGFLPNDPVSLLLAKMRR